MDNILPWLRSTNILCWEYYSIYLLVILIGSTEADLMTEMCELCLNNSTCSMVTNINQKNSSTLHCICKHGWLGEYCESHTDLALHSVSMTSVTLRWQIVPNTSLEYSDTVYHTIDAWSKDIVPQSLNGPTYTVAYSNTQMLTPSFTIFYWREDDRHQCNIISNITEDTLTISGLTVDTSYIFCVTIDIMYTCDIDLVWEDYIGATCLHVSTKPVPTIPLVYVILVSSVACISLVILMILFIIAKRNHVLPALICAKVDKSSMYQTECRRTLPRPKISTSSTERHPDIYLCNTSNQQISIHPPNCPRNVKYQVQHKRTRGYASFTARNEQTIALSTVLEYTTCDQEEEDITVSDDDDNDDNNEVQAVTPFIDNNGDDDDT